MVTDMHDLLTLPLFLPLLPQLRRRERQ